MWIKMTHYIIGESPIEKLDDAVQMELTHGIYPLVTAKKNNRNNYRNNVMERYAGLIVEACVKARQLGVTEFTNEGCKADMTYHEGNSNECLRIQIKTTAHLKPYQRTDARCYDIWHFQMKKYPGHLIILRSIEDAKTWIIPYDYMAETYTGSEVKIYDLADNKKYWDRFAVTNDRLADTIHEYYLSRQNLQVIKQSIAEIPVYITQQKELAYKNRLAQFIQPLKQPPIEQSHYDMILDDIRIQAKVSFPCKHVAGYRVSMNTGRDQVPYQRNDFDALVIYLQDITAEIFYFIPMIVLIRHDIVKSKQSTGKKSMTLYPPEALEKTKYHVISKWANQYIFRYDTPDLRSVLISLFNNTYS
jgi:hypothetical protein